MSNVLIPKEYGRTRDLVAIPRKDYERFFGTRPKRTVSQRPTLTQREREERDVLAIIKEAEADYRAGRTRVVQSLSELLD